MERAEGMLDKYGPAMPVTNMPRLLQQVAGRAERISHALEDRVNEMTSMSTYSDKAGEQLRAEVGALMTCWNLLRQIATDATKLDLEAWSVRIEAAKAAAIVAVLEAGVCAAGLDDVQAWRLREAMRDGLNELEAGA